MSLVEGIGDEVLTCFVIIVLIVLLLVAWWSTNVRPLWSGDSVWLVQVETEPNRRVLQVVQLNESAAAEVEQSNQARTLRLQEATTAAPGEVPPLIPVQDNNNSGVSENNQTGTSLVDNALTEARDASGEHSTSTAHTADHKSEGEAPTSETESKEPDFNIRLKFLDETQKLVSAWLSQSVGEFKRQNFGSEVSSGQTIRLIYQGQLLRDDARSLESYGLTDNCIVHCHVSNVPYAGSGSNTQNTNAAGDAVRRRSTGVAQHRRLPHHHHHHGGAFIGEHRFAIGRYSSLIFGVKFGLLWAFFAMYPQYFDFSSFFSLLLCTVIYVAFMYHSHGPVPGPADANRPATNATQPTAAPTDATRSS